MEIKSKVLFGIGLLVLVLSSFSVSLFFILKDEEVVISSDISFAEILITKNSDFTEKYHFQGNGTSANPFLLENLIIDTSKDCGISINNTTKHFVIRNCTITTVKTGIFLSSIAYFTCLISNNTITTGNTDKEWSWYYGIYVYNADSIIIENNFCFNSYHYFFYRSGIKVIQSSNIIARNNSCQNHWNGLEFTTSSGVIANNTLCYNEHGIYLFSCQDIDLINNNCSFNYYSGLYLRECEFNLMKQNIIENNRDHGIIISDCKSITIAFNNLRQEGINIYVDFTTSSIIHYNNFFKIETNSSHLLQAIEYGEDNTWFDIGTHEGNYWSDLIWEIGVVYQIPGSQDNNDLYPLDSPVGY